MADELHIGARLRALRRDQKLSIRSLARKCDLSPNTLSLIENDRTSPSLNTLHSLARGLGVPLAAIFETEKTEFTLVYQQQGQRDLMRFAYGTLENLGHGLPPLGAEPILVALNPQCPETKNFNHSGREFIYCLEGKVSCFVADQEYLLAPGDSILFDARAPHRWQNLHTASSRMLVLFCPAEAHDRTAEQHVS